MKRDKEAASTTPPERRSDLPGEKVLSTQSKDFYQKVYQEYRTAVVGFFRSRGYSEPEALDGLQDVYLRVIRLSQPEQLAEHPKAYLLKVATNLVRDHYRKRSAVKIINQDLMELDEIPALEPSPEQQLQTRQQIAIVKKAILELSEKHRDIFIMHRMDGLTCNEIAENMKMPLRTVQRRLSDALAYCVVKVKKEIGVKH